MSTDSSAALGPTVSPRALAVALGLVLSVAVLWWTVALDLDAGARSGLAGLIGDAVQGGAIGAADAWASAVRRLVYAIAVLSAPFVFPGLRRHLEGFGARFVGEASAESVGLLRIAAAGTLLASSLWEDLPSIAHLPESLARSMGVIDLLRLLGLDALARSEAALVAFSWTTRGLLLVATLGLFGRFTVPSAALAYLVFGGLLRSYTKFFHTGLLPLWVLLTLSFFPTTDALSLDALRRRGEAPDAARRHLYGWARYTALGVLAISYFAAGTSKIWNGGLLWWHPDNLRTIMAMDGLNPMEFSWGLSLPLARGPGLLLAGIGLATVVLETAMIATLFSHRARWLLPVTMLGMHLGIWFAQNVLFFDLMLLLCTWYALSITDRRLPAPSVYFQGSAPNPAPAPSTPASRSAARRFAILAGVLLVAHAAGLEFYPLTGMQMYSRRNRDGVVRYHRLVRIDADGREHEARPDEWVGALRDARHRFVVQRCFGSGSTEACRDFLSAYGGWLVESGAAPSTVAVEAQEWHWHFLEDPDDPRHGEVHARVREDVVTEAYALVAPPAP